MPLKPVMGLVLVLRVISFDLLKFAVLAVYIQISITLSIMLQSAEYYFAVVF